MGHNSSKEFVQPILTLSSIAGLNIPCLASRMDRNTALGSLQNLGFPFNMSEKFMNRNFSFSSKNLLKGRLHTCVTCLFNHAGVDHFTSNMMVLFNCGYTVHVSYGRQQMLTAFFGGGIAGCMAQFSLYLYQKVHWENIFPSPKNWKIFGDTFVLHLHNWQRKALSNVFSHVNAWRPCIGCSAAVSSLMAIQACYNITLLADKLRQPNPLLDVEALYQISQLLFTSLVVYEDVRMLLGATARDKGLVGSLVAYSVDGVGHAAHVGGFVFGLLYFVFVLYKKKNIEGDKTFST